METLRKIRLGIAGSVMLLATNGCVSIPLAEELRQAQNSLKKCNDLTEAADDVIYACNAHMKMHRKDWTLKQNDLDKDF